MLSHLKELKVEKGKEISYGHVESSVELSPGGFRDSTSTDNNVETGKSRHRLHSKPEELSDDDVDTDASTAKIDSRMLGHDPRFRVNGILVDSEVKGGARSGWEGVYEIMFKSITPTGQRVALVLLVMVSMSVVVAVLDSVDDFRDDIGNYLLALEAFFTVVFTVEYCLRLLSLRNPSSFAFSLMGFVDMCALVPSYLGFILPDARPLLHLAVLRIFRVMRVFRLLRLARFVDAGAALSDNIETNKRRIAVFLVALFTMILVIGCAMYLIEGDSHDFSNIPISLYWTVVTMTTVGYGDISPHTIVGRMLATVVMFVGYGIIACPLILNQTGSQDILTEVIECPRCFRRLHQDDANFCRVCGTSLRQPRVKSLKARRDRRLRLAKLQLQVPENGLQMSTSSTMRSNMRLLPEGLDSTRTIDSAMG
ncbi:chloride channel family [Plasmopara halstedii]|uniref:Chloride channel family n=1 Tax=Plasmopara halstedii TaxID=4781 RepID=A0A0P1A9I9_PLAHL|nr:chloride channel family [Plasmopara halstedii]CEG36886.1 chloride channel family [Plasmopara halstedii]|eukprot:XP_024573255.1 chloride channel family [Plasmopara halstedii]